MALLNGNAGTQVHQIRVEVHFGGPAAVLFSTFRSSAEFAPLCSAASPFPRVHANLPDHPVNKDMRLPLLFRKTHPSESCSEMQLEKLHPSMHHLDNHTVRDSHHFLGAFSPSPLGSRITSESIVLSPKYSAQEILRNYVLKGLCRDIPYSLRHTHH